MPFVFSPLILFSAAQRCLTSIVISVALFAAKFQEYTLMIFKYLHSSIAFRTQKNILCARRKIGDKCDQQTVITTLSDQTDKKTSLHSVSKNYGFPSTTLYCSFDKDFLAPDFQNKGRMQRVFTPD
jgi:hypothetical protein